MSRQPRAPRSTARLPGAYWRLWSASTVSNLGDGIFLVALPLLAARLTRSAVSISLVAAAATLPWLILSLPIGTIIDRSDRKRILLVADTIRAIVIGVLAVLAATGHVRIWMLWITALALGIAEVFFDNASQALVPAVVPAELLERGNGRLYAAEILANLFIGAPLGSVLFAAAIWLPFGIDAASFVLAVLLILPIRGSFQARAGDPVPSGSLVNETKQGIRWLWDHPLLRTLAIALGLSNLGFQMAQAVFVLFAAERLGISERGFGILLGLMGVGALLGALLGERIAAHIGRAGAIRGTLITWFITMTATGLFPVTWFVALMAIVESMAATVWNVVVVSLRQQIVPTELFGRVNSVYRWFAWGTLPIGSVIGGQVARAYGLRAPYFIGAVFVFIALVLVLRNVTAASIERATSTESSLDYALALRTPAPPSIT